MTLRHKKCQFQVVNNPRFCIFGYFSLMTLLMTVLLERYTNLNSMQRGRDCVMTTSTIGSSERTQYGSIYLYSWFFDRIYRANLRLTPRRDEYCASKEKSFSFVIIMRCAFTTAETATMQWNM